MPRDLRSTPRRQGRAARALPALPRRPRAVDLGAEPESRQPFEPDRGEVLQDERARGDRAREDLAEGLRSHLAATAGETQSLGLTAAFAASGAMPRRLRRARVIGGQMGDECDAGGPELRILRESDRRVLPAPLREGATLAVVGMRLEPEVRVAH